MKRTITNWLGLCFLAIAFIACTGQSSNSQLIYSPSKSLEVIITFKAVALAPKLNSIAVV